MATPAAAVVLVFPETRLFEFLDERAGGTWLSVSITVLWFLGQGIGHRPLLQLGVLLSVVGMQLVFTGLIGEMVADRGFDPDTIYSVREIL